MKLISNKRKTEFENHPLTKASNLYFSIHTGNGTPLNNKQKLELIFNTIDRIKKNKPLIDNLPKDIVIQVQKQRELIIDEIKYLNFLKNKLLLHRNQIIPKIRRQKNGSSEEIFEDYLKTIDSTIKTLDKKDYDSFRLRWY
ncbi:MAG: hypothetical protein V1824_00065 [archaeon]